MSIIALDYPRRKRLKFWGHAQIVEDPDVIGLLREGTGPKVERGIVIRVAAFDWNCPQHITERYTLTQVQSSIQPLHDRIAALEQELALAQSKA